MLSHEDDSLYYILNNHKINILSLMSYLHDIVPLFSMTRLKPFLPAVLCIALAACQGSAAPQAPDMKHVTIGIQTSPAMALVMVAKDAGFFEKQGLDVELKEFTAGKFALEAFLAGSLDYAVSGDVPPALAALQGHSFVVPAQLVGRTSNEVRVVARRDGSESTAKEYFTSKKRKLATSIGGGPEFFTYELLNKLGIPQDGVEIVSQKPGDMPAALAAGSVDAIAIFDPFAFIAEKQLGADGVTFTDGTVYSELYVLEAHEDTRKNPEEVTKLLNALIAAEDFTRASPEKAKEIVVRYTKLDAATVDGIWKSFDFRIALTPQLTEYWNREVEWAKKTGKASADTPVPDFSSLLLIDPLKRIDASRVEL